MAAAPEADALTQGVDEPRDLGVVRSSSSCPRKSIGLGLLSTFGACRFSAALVLTLETS
jgi:hypothetical protein